MRADDDQVSAPGIGCFGNRLGQVRTELVVERLIGCDAGSRDQLARLVQDLLAGFAHGLGQRSRITAKLVVAGGIRHLVDDVDQPHPGAKGLGELQRGGERQV